MRERELKRSQLTAMVGLVVGLSVFLSACGGSSSGEDGHANNAAAPATVQGAAVKGPFLGAVIKLHKHDSHGQIASSTPLATANTNSEGNFSTPALPNGQTALIGVSGGGFYDESDPSLQRFIKWPEGDEMFGFLPPSASTAAITPVSDALVRKSRRDAHTGLAFLHSVAENRRLAALAFGFDPISVIPPNPTRPPAGASQQQLQYAMYLGGIALAVNSVAISLGLPEPDYELLRVVLKDMEDCVLDGQFFGQVLDYQGQALPNNINLQHEIERFRNNYFGRLGKAPLVKINVPLCADKLPRAVNDAVSTQEDQEILIPVLANDSDPDGSLNPATLEIIAKPSNGQLKVDLVGGNIRYLPNAEYFGTDSFQYRVQDNLGARSNVASVAITIIRFNDLPVANNDARAILEDSEPVEIDVLANDTDVDGTIDRAALEIVSGPSNGAASINPARNIVYTPNANFNGSDSLTYRVRDNDGGLSNIATLTITVGAVNDPPVISDVTDQTIPEDTSTGPIPFNVDDVDQAPGTLTVSATSSNQALVPNGSIVLGGSGLNRTVMATPVANGFGSTTITLKVTDASGGTATDIFVVNVTPVNDPPTAVNDSFTVAEDSTSNSLNVLLNDSIAPDTGETLTIVGFTTPDKGGAVSIVAGSSLSYTPKADFFGTETFSYTINDGTPGSNATATVTMKVTNVNDLPVAVADAFTVNEGGTATTLTGGATSVLLNDTDPDPELLTAILVAGPANSLSFTLNPDGTFSYTHNGSETTRDSFTYKANDGTGDSNTATVSITINPVNDAPVAVNDSLQVNMNSSFTTQGCSVSCDSLEGGAISLLTNDTDPENDPLKVNGASSGLPLTLTSAQGGAVSIYENGTLSYTPPADYWGLDSFAYQATDGSLLSNAAVVNVKVIGPPPIVWGMNNFENELVAFNADTGVINIRHTLNLNSGPVTGTIDRATALTYDSTTGLIYGVVRIDTNTSDRILVTVDLRTGNATSIGYLGDKFAGLTVDDAGVLYGVTGDGGKCSECLFTINKTTAAPNLVMNLGNGDDGEAIAFNPIDSHIYHASGISGEGAGAVPIFEKINPTEKTIVDVSYSGDAPEEANGLVFDQHRDRFIAVDSASDIFSISSTGSSNIIASGIDVVALRGYAILQGEDADYDGLPDAYETGIGSNPNHADSDDDGLRDGDEVNIYGTDPKNVDSDGDGIEDGDEVNLYGTDPNITDTDGDGYTDDDEINNLGTDPNDPDSPHVNLPPANTTPARYSVPIGGSRAITGLVVSDPDAGTSDLQVTLAVDGGHTLSVRTDVAGGLVAGDFSGSAANVPTVTFAAPISRINATLEAPNGLVFEDANGVTGIANLTMTTDDLGNQGVGGALQDIDTVKLHIHIIEVEFVDGLNGLEIAGANGGDQTGERLDFGGDFNNDGFADIALTAHQANAAGRHVAGKSYVFFGAEESAATPSIRISGSGRDVRVLGEQAFDHIGQDVANIGDVNADGIDDLLTSAQFFRGGSDKGRAYVLFGSNSPSLVVDLAQTSPNPMNGVTGFQMTGLNNGDRTGFKVGMGGDVNGDGISDFIIGTPNIASGNGEAYLLFGAPDIGATGNFNLTTLDGTNGYRIKGASGDALTVDLSLIGDVDGDGVDEVLIGARLNSTNALNSGVAYLIFGSQLDVLDAVDGTDGIINVANLSAVTGVVLRGETNEEIAGASVAGGGDVNGDGFNDFIIGAPKASDIAVNAGRAYLVYGGNSIGTNGVLELGDLAGSSNGVIFKGLQPNAQAGRSLAISSDLNGDGFDDIAIGSPNARIQGLPNVGEVWVIFGGPSIGTLGQLDLGELSGTEGLRIQGFRQGSHNGITAMGGDFNGDGLRDIATGGGFFFNSSPPADQTGYGYLIYGNDYSGVAGIINGTSGNDDDPGLFGTNGRDVIVAGRGNDYLDGAGDADVLYAGAGNDLIVLDVNDVRVDGGSGNDTLVLSGTPLFDLPALNASGANYNRFINIEIIQLNSALKVNPRDLLRMTDARNTLRVDGTSTDSISSDESWNENGTVIINGDNYVQYKIGNALLQVHVDVDRSGLGALDPMLDADNDGLSNGEESVAGTDPNLADSDGDHINDFVEVQTGGDPLVADVMVLHVQPPSSVTCPSLGNGSDWGDGKAYCNNSEVSTHLKLLDGSVGRCHVLYQGDSAQYNYGTLDLTLLGGSSACSQIILVGGINDYELNTGRYTHSNSLVDGGGVCAGPSGTPNQRPITVPDTVTFFGLFGFSLTGGRLTGTTASDNGGGIAFRESTGTNNFLISDTQIFSNCAVMEGGGAYIGSGWAGKLNNSDFTDNSTSDGSSKGGGLFKSNAVTPTVVELHGTKFNVNTSVFAGGGAYFENTDLIVTQSKFTSNLLFGDNTPAASGCYGGGLHTNLGLIDIRQTIFAGNTAFCADPGGFSGGGGAIISQPDSGSMVVDSEFLGNQVTDEGGGFNFPIGGGMAATFVNSSTSSLEVRNNLFVGNGSEGVGGGVGIADSDSVTLRLNSIAYNQATNIYDQLDLGMTGTGGGVFAYNSNGITLEDNIVYDNHDGFLSAPDNPGEDCRSVATSTMNTSNNLIELSNNCNDGESTRRTANPWWYGRFYLSQSPAPLSAAVNSGSVADADSYFCGLVSQAPGCGHGYTTNRSGADDVAALDRGYHHRQPAGDPPTSVVDYDGPYDDGGFCSVIMSFDLIDASTISIGSGHKVAVCVSGTDPNAADYSLSSNTTFDAVTGDVSSPDSSCAGKAVLARDQGDGLYSFDLTTQGGLFSGPVAMKVFVDNFSPALDYSPSLTVKTGCGPS